MSVLTELMGRRVVVLEQLLMVSEKQLKLVQRNDVTTLLQLLARKQRFLDDLETVERELDPYRDQNPEDRTWNDEEDKRECTQSMDRCTVLLQTIMEVDRQSEQELATLMKQTQTELKKTESGGRAATAYAKQNMPVKNQNTTSFDFKK